MVVLGFPVVDIMKVIGKMHRVHMENLELTQLRLVEAIAETGNLSSAAEVVGLSQSALSQHLAKMRDEGLVAYRRERQTLWYRIADPRTEALLATLYQLYCKDV